MNSTCIAVKQNPFLQYKPESVCIVCNKDVSNNESKSIQEALPQVEPPTTILEALKSLSNFQQLNIENEQLSICNSCLLNTSLARWFQILCNKSAENFKAYLGTQSDHKCINTHIPAVTESKEQNITEFNKNVNKEEEECLNFMNSEVKSEEIVVTYDGDEENKNEQRTCDEVNDASETDGSDDDDNDDDYEEENKEVKKRKGIKCKTKRKYAPVPKKECPHCHVLYRRDYLSIHVRIHTGVMPHVCKICGKGFKVKSSLTNHMLYHNNERNFLCTFCGSGFHLKTQLDNHIRMHTDERPYVCETCGKAFRTTTARRIHYTVHTGEKNYACEKCPKTFSTARSLRQHKVVHAEIKPFECTFCGKRFPHRHVLKSHQAKTCQRINSA